MYLKVLDEKRKEVFDVLEDLSFIDNFELSGGTALALQMGHRISVDFDFFCANFLDRDFGVKIEKELKNNNIEILINNDEELTLLIDKVKVTFLYYPFARVLPLVNLKGLKALSIPEIAATKAYTIGRRREYKDYVDLYFMLKDKKVTLNEILELCEKKYGTKFNSRLFLEQLVFDKDVEEVKILFLEESVDKKEIFEFFKKYLSSEFKFAP